MARALTALATLVVTAIVCIVLAIVALNRGWLSPFGVESTSRDSQVVRTVERTEEVSLVSLGVQGIERKSETSEIFGRNIPGTSRVRFVQYSFDAKLGLDGADVDIDENGGGSFTVSVPRFEFIGYDNLELQTAAEDGDLLSFVTADPDEFDAVDKVLSEAAQADYLAKNDALLRDQTEFFYGSLIRSVAPDAEVQFEFTDAVE